MTANDCYHLGLQLYKTKDYVHTAQWLEEAIIQLNGTDEKFQIQIMEKLSSAYYHKSIINSLFLFGNKKCIYQPYAFIMRTNILF